MHQEKSSQTCTWTIALPVLVTLELQSLDKMMERGGFNLTKWASNSKEVLSHIAEQEQVESITIDFNASVPGKVLGMSGNTSTGCLLFSVSASVITANDPETKRVCSLLMIPKRRETC